MQQVAAQKTDLAALPFSATGTSNAVKTGIGSHNESQNNRAFNNLYREAKSDKPDFVLNKDQKTSDTSRHTNSVSSNNYEHNPRDAAHKNHAKQNSEVSASSKGGYQNDNHSQNDSSHNARTDRSHKPKAPQNDASNARAESQSTASNTEEAELADGYHGVGKGDNSGLEADMGDGGQHASQDDAAEETSDLDWLAFVEKIACQNGDDTLSEGTPGKHECLGEGEAGAQWTLPEHVDETSVESVLAHLIEKLGEGETGLSDKQNTQDMSEDALNALRALGDLLRGLSGDGQVESAELLRQLNTETSTNGEDGSASENSLSSLISQLLGQNNSDDTGITSSDDKATSDMSAEDAFILSIVEQEMSAAVSDDAEALASETVGVLASSVGSQQSSSAGGNEKGEGALHTHNTPDGKAKNDAVLSNEQVQGVGDSLLAEISELPTESAQKAAEAIADRIVAAMPSGPQQQAVKTNIIAGINEFQQQLEQGREPGIDLGTLVADAAKEAMVSAETMSSLNARVENQASQFLQLMNNTQNSVHQVMQGQLANVDTAINENSQLRAEASKTQQQFEGFDKAVNIHKPEGQQQLNEKIRWMVNARNTMAEIRLDPPELGSMQVRVNVSGDAASVSFVVQSQHAKDALADAMPKLKDMLSEQGIELGDAQVRKDNSSDGQGGQQFANNTNTSGDQKNSGNNGGFDDGDTRVVEQAITRADKGGIDFYA